MCLVSHTELGGLRERAEGVCLVLHRGTEGVGERTRRVGPCDTQDWRRGQGTGGVVLVSCTGWGVEKTGGVCQGHTSDQGSVSG